MLANNPYAIIGDFVAFTKSLFDCLTLLDGKSRLLVERSGKVVVSSSSTEAIFADGRFLKLDREHLKASKTTNGGTLTALLAVPGGIVETAALRADLADEPMVIRTTALNDTLICMCMNGAEGKADNSLPDLAKLFGLTPCEVGIVHDLYHGRTPRWIAEHHSNSIHTIRAHIRHCYDKMGVSCREELWNLLNDHRTG